MRGRSTNSGICRRSEEIRSKFGWNFRCSTKDGFRLEAAIDGAGPSIHRLPYVKTDCSGSFEVTNNSLAKASLRLERPGGPIETLETSYRARYWRWCQRPLTAHSDDCAFARRSATIEYAAGLNAIPM